MADDTGGDVFVASREKARNGYGQNGYQGPSSDLPGQATRMDRDYGLAADPSAAPGDWQTRKVDATPYATTHGMKAAASPVLVPAGNNHRPYRPISGKTGGFQR